MAVDMFIKLGDIKGESQDKTHKGEIDVLAWSWGMAKSGTTHVGGGGGSGKEDSERPEDEAETLLLLTKKIETLSTNIVALTAEIVALKKSK